MACSGSCPDCGRPVSMISAITIIRGGAVVLICPTCRDAPAAIPQTAEPQPTITSEPTALVTSLEPPPTFESPPGPKAMPAVKSIRKRHPTAPELADITGEIALQRKEVADSTTGSKRPLALIATAAAAAAIGGFFALHSSSASSAQALAATAADSLQTKPLARICLAPDETPRRHILSVALSDEDSALAWVHPISTLRQMPDKDDRRFGAERPGDRPGECGAGHCGVDLAGGRGAVVHATLSGRLIRVKRGAGGGSGKYVAIEHPQGLRSHYMHLDRVHPDLVEGMEIASGEAIGTLGSTGVRNSPPHLHFTVQKLINGGWRYVDPEPMLEASTLLTRSAPLPEAPLAQEPSILERIHHDAPTLSPSPSPPPKRSAPRQLRRVSDSPSPPSKPILGPLPATIVPMKETAEE